jgi:hypothetical protein
MTIDERSLLLLLARMVLTGVSNGPDERELRIAIARIEAAEDRAADEERLNNHG